MRLSFQAAGDSDEKKGWYPSGNCLFWHIDAELVHDQRIGFWHDWSGSFYNNTSFSGNVAATINGINGLNFNWPGQPNVNGVAVTQVGEDNFSARFTSSQNFSQANYQFSMTYDDDIRVLIDGQNVFEDFSGGPVKTRTINRDMTAGTHTLSVDFVEVTQAAVLQFQWFLGGRRGRHRDRWPDPNSWPDEHALRPPACQPFQAGRSARR